MVDVEGGVCCCESDLFAACDDDEEGGDMVGIVEDIFGACRSVGMCGKKSPQKRGLAGGKTFQHSRALDMYSTYSTDGNEKEVMGTGVYYNL